MVVLHAVHAASKFAHTLCDVSAGFHVMYIHMMHGMDIFFFAYFVFPFSKGEGFGEKRLVLVS